MQAMATTMGTPIIATQTKTLPIKEKTLPHILMTARVALTWQLSLTRVVKGDRQDTTVTSSSLLRTLTTAASAKVTQDGFSREEVKKTNIC
mmetsp:Transcript_1667/g.3883  ORF Transcript_1667/g.3883 Transcript_1667/m.3883 type:complete len:91 (-) Transcript_1667:329-601(-)